MRISARREHGRAPLDRRPTHRDRIIETVERGLALFADGGPAALDAPDLEGAGGEHDAQREARERSGQRQPLAPERHRQGYGGESRERGQPGPDGRAAAQPLSRRDACETSGDYGMTAPPLPSPRPLHLGVLTPDAVRAALLRDSRLLVPVGTCEQHGPHLPLGCDTIIVERLADDLSAEFGILRAPTIPFGVNTATKRPYPGNATVRRKTLHRWMNDLLGSWEQCGVDAFIILTAHGHDPHQEALSTLRTRQARVFTVDIFALDFTGYLDEPSGRTHGRELDTSLMLHLAPQLVRMGLAQDFTLSERQLARFRRRAAGAVPALSPGSVGRPTLASAEKGARLYKMIHDRIATRVLGAVAA